jgi:hypothetical protein
VEELLSADPWDPAGDPRLNTRHVARSREVVTSFFDGTRLVEPGLVRVSDWRPDSPEEAATPTILWGGVAGKH